MKPRPLPETSDVYLGVDPGIAVGKGSAVATLCRDGAVICRVGGGEGTVLQRLMDQREQLRDLGVGVDRAALEKPPPGLQGHAEALLPLYYYLSEALAGRPEPVVVVAAGTLKKFITGHGSAAKEVVCQAAYDQWGYLLGEDAYLTTDQADALGLAMIACAVHHPENPVWAPWQRMIALKLGGTG